MGSVVLARQNESSWVPMVKIPFSNTYVDGKPNLKQKKKQKQFNYAAGNDFVGRYNGGCPSGMQTVSDDAYSFNQTSTSRNEVNYGSYLTYNVATYSNSELVVLRKRFSADLDVIRDLRDRIESGKCGDFRKSGSESKLKRRTESQPSVVSAMDSNRLNHGFDIPFGDAQNSLKDMLKDCKHILIKLLKHKSGWIFKSPVDAVGLGLHDYHLIVKRPMDLGTVKANLNNSLYPSAAEFASDVRLTFNNALLYNPKNDPVNGLAQQMLSRFEELFKPLQGRIDDFSKREREPRDSRVIREKQMDVNEEFQGSSWNHQICEPFPSNGNKSKPKASGVGSPHISKKHEKIQTVMEAHSGASTASNPPHPEAHRLLKSQKNHFPQGVPFLRAKEPKVGKGAGPVKQPKPRAKDQNKRAMSMEEKQKLGFGLQGMPQEKMSQLVHIVRKRNEQLAQQDGDEIELDIEALDTETLWELDRFVTNWKKMVSKTKRQAWMTNTNSATGVAIPTLISESDVGAMDEENEDSGKKLKENSDEDVDIDDDTPRTNFPPVEIEKDEGAGGGIGGNAGNARSGSSSSSSSSSDSSSSDSDSGGSSGSDSDADDAQS